MNGRVPVLMAAASVAMCARSGGLTQQAVDEMRVRAEELLDRDDPLRRDVFWFATQWEAVRRDPDALALIGALLLAAVERETVPRVPGTDRVDLHG